MKFFKKIELEWKIVAVGALLFIGFIGPVPYFISRVNTSLTGSVDPQVEQLLRLQVASPDSAIAHQAVASLERQRQWFAMLPIVRGEQQRSFFY